MNIIIAGDGKLGNTISKHLTAEGHDITVIDSSKQALESSIEQYDIMSVYGNCATKEVLVQAGIKEADLLIIDDLGTEVQSSFSVQLLNEIINERIALGKKIIISTNLTMKGILEKYTDRVASRIYESFEILHFVGNDIRVQKLMNKGENK